MPSVVDVLPQLETSRFDRPFTYLLPTEMAAGIGDVVKVPLGPREVLAYVVDGPRSGEGDGLREVLDRLEGSRAFAPEMLALARWVAEYYLCTLSEALRAVVLASAIPRVRERYVVAAPAPRPHPAVPERLARLIWGDLREGFTREALLRHPDARRAGDRTALLAALRALVTRGDVERRRAVARARSQERRVRVLVRASDVVPKGTKARELAASVDGNGGEMRRADALLAGFSAAVIGRAVGSGALREEQRAAVTREAEAPPALPDLLPTPEQQNAIDRIAERLRARTFGEILVAGVTGSGKTLVYLHAIAGAVREGGRAIMLVPEISLTPQTARRFESVFASRVAVLHSGLSERERYDAWQRAARGEIDVVVGARSAVFAPLANVRLIVVDEAHETSYKQDNVPRYHAVTVARERMRRAGGVLVLGSATPPLEEYARAKAGRAELIPLRTRATDAPLPATRIVDMREELAGGNRRIFSTALIEGIERRLTLGEKTVLFLNRRGSASFLLCRTCGVVAECTRCTTSLTVHRADQLLRCHYCDQQRPIPSHCPSCGSDTIREFGVGTQRVVAELERIVPAARVVRMDSDTTTRIGDHARLLDAFAGEGDILVGTQMVAKGLDFPDVTLVGIVAADIGLHHADYRAAERTFGLIVQATGRSGRVRAGESIVQTYAPSHPAIALAAAGDYERFAELELAERRSLGYPPFRAMAALGAISRDRSAAQRAIADYAEIIRESETAEVLGPAPYAIERMNGEWRYRLALKTRVREPLRAVIREKIVAIARGDRTTRLVINVDP